VALVNISVEERDVEQEEILRREPKSHKIDNVPVNVAIIQAAVVAPW
jgi:hypothetical protein